MRVAFWLLYGDATTLTTSKMFRREAGKDFARRSTSNPLVIDAHDLAQARAILTHGGFLFGWLVRSNPELRGHQPLKFRERLSTSSHSMILRRKWPDSSQTEVRNRREAERYQGHKTPIIVFLLIGAVFSLHSSGNSLASQEVRKLKEQIDTAWKGNARPVTSPSTLRACAHSRDVSHAASSPPIFVAAGLPCILGEKIYPEGSTIDICRLEMAINAGFKCPLVAHAIPSYSCSNGQWRCKQFCLPGSVWLPGRSVYSR
jgi:hypothetical protein